MKLLPALALGGVALLGYAILRRPSSSSSSRVTAAVPVREVRSSPAPSPAPPARVVVIEAPAPPVAAARTPTVVQAPKGGVLEDPLSRAAIRSIAPAAPGIVGRPVGNALTTVGDRITTRGPQLGGLDASAKVGGALTSVGTFVGNVEAPLLGVFTGEVLTGSTKTKTDRINTYGRAAVSTAQTALGAVPIVGTALGGLLQAGSLTYEGQRATRATGRVIEQGDSFQRSLLSSNPGKAFDPGGSNPAQRRGNYANLVAARLSQLEREGGTLSANDVDGFQRAVRDYGLSFKSSIFGGRTYAEWASGIEPGTTIARQT